GLGHLGAAAQQARVVRSLLDRLHLQPGSGAGLGATVQLARLVVQRRKGPADRRDGARDRPEEAARTDRAGTGRVLRGRGAAQGRRLLPATGDAQGPARVRAGAVPLLLERLAGEGGAGDAPAGRSTRPGRAPVCWPPLITTRPFTSTSPMPVA